MFSTVVRSKRCWFTFIVRSTRRFWRIKLVAVWMMQQGLRRKGLSSLMILVLFQFKMLVEFELRGFVEV